MCEHAGGGLLGYEKLLMFAILEALLNDLAAVDDLLVYVDITD